ncbi:MAG: enoyl-CoA hydratase/isomerase family protein [Alphaproteobacteria bacterium]|nr:enoyl-CoA hydratase/isomerase family protein [Alphaproteobacteria bacterium]MCB9931035.1 enoyl-CoA hydratase/isomerase family protein [Alphaproteobacteria bacterium]
MSSPLVLVERKSYGARGHVAWVTVNKARRANCLDHETLIAFTDAVNEESKSPDLRAMVVTGAGERAFMAGADLNVIAGQDADGAKLFLTRVHLFCQSVRECPVPVIARINGACFGAALELVAACDLRIASDNAAFGMPEVNVGLPSVVEACLLPQLIGWGKTKHLVYTAETIDADKAMAWGLLESLVPQAELDAEVERVVSMIVHAAPTTMRLQKDLVRAWEGMGTEAAILEGIRVAERTYRLSNEPAEYAGAVLAGLKKKD